MAETQALSPDDDDFNWRKEVKKWEFGIDLAKATQDDLNTFCRAKVKEYEIHQILDNQLRDFFQEDFKDFEKEHFLLIGRVHVQSLYNFVRLGGVYVATDSKSKSTIQTLMDAAREEEQHVWTNSDIKELLEEYPMEQIGSQRLRIRLQEPAFQEMVALQEQKQAHVKAQQQEQEQAHIEAPPHVEAQSHVKAQQQEQEQAHIEAPPHVEAQSHVKAQQQEQAPVLLQGVIYVEAPAHAYAKEQHPQPQEAKSTQPAYQPTQEAKSPQPACQPTQEAKFPQPVQQPVHQPANQPACQPVQQPTQEAKFPQPANQPANQPASQPVQQPTQEAKFPQPVHQLVQQPVYQPACLPVEQFNQQGSNNSNGTTIAKASNIDLPIVLRTDLKSLEIIEVDWGGSTAVIRA